MVAPVAPFLLPPNLLAPKGVIVHGNHVAQVEQQQAEPTGQGSGKHGQHRAGNSGQDEDSTGQNEESIHFFDVKDTYFESLLVLLDLRSRTGKTFPDFLHDEKY